MKHLRNPVTGEVTLATPLMAKKLARYGWTYVTLAEWVAYKRAIIQRAAIKHVSQAQERMH